MAYDDRPWFRYLCQGYHHPNRQMPDHTPRRVIGALEQRGFIVPYEEDWILTDAGVRCVERSR